MFWSKKTLEVCVLGTSETSVHIEDESKAPTETLTEAVERAGTIKVSFCHKIALNLRRFACTSLIDIALGIAAMAFAFQLAGQRQRQRSEGEADDEREF